MWIIDSSWWCKVSEPEDDQTLSADSAMQFRHFLLSERISLRVDRHGQGAFPVSYTHLIGELKQITCQYGFVASGARKDRKFDSGLGGGALLDVYKRQGSACSTMLRACSF